MDKIKAGTMKELIDKASVVAEIEGYISNYKDIVAKTNRNDSTWVNSVSMIDAKIDVIRHLLSFLNTLEVKEVDFEKIWKEYFRPAFENEIPQKPKWNENDEHHLRMCLECVEECAFQDREDFSKTIDWLKSLKQRMEEQ